MDERRTTRGRKLLAATIGLATVTLTGCGGATSGNLVAPPPPDGAAEVDAAAESDAGSETDAGTETDAAAETDDASTE